jgi:hypothetical protein
MAFLVFEVGMFALALTQRPNDALSPSLAYAFMNRVTQPEQFVYDFLFNNIFLALFFALGWVLSIRSRSHQRSSPQVTTHKMSFRNQLMCMKDSLVLVAFLVALILAIRLTTGSTSVPVTVCGLFGLALILPPICLHIQYYQLNKVIRLEVDSTSKQFTICRDGSSKVVLFGNIKDVVMYFGGKSDTTWSEYQYSVIETIDGDQILITSLLLRYQREFFSNLNIRADSKEVFFPWVRRGHIQEESTA